MRSDEIPPAEVAIPSQQGCRAAGMRQHHSLMVTISEGKGDPMLRNPSVVTLFAAVVAVVGGACACLLLG